MSVFEEEVEKYLAQEQARYDAEVAQARADAKTAWDENLPEMRAQLENEIESKVAGRRSELEQPFMVDDPENPMPEDEKAALQEKNEQELTALRERLTAEMEQELARQEKRQIDDASSIVTEPMPRHIVESMLSHLREPEAMLDDSAMNYSAPDVEHAYYRLADGRIYSVEDAQFLVARAVTPPEDMIIDVPGGTEADLRTGILEFYQANGHPSIIVGDELLTSAELTDRNINKVNAATSEAILAGFDYDIDGETYHFSYDEHDQQNFADKANACLAAASASVATLDADGTGGEAQAIYWNAYDSTGQRVRLQMPIQAFMALYLDGALKHKDDCLLRGEQQKAEILAAAPKE